MYISGVYICRNLLAGPAHDVIATKHKSPSMHAYERGGFALKYLYHKRYILSAPLSPPAVRRFDVFFGVLVNLTLAFKMQNASSKLTLNLYTQFH